MKGHEGVGQLGCSRSPWAGPSLLQSRDLARSRDLADHERPCLMEDPDVIHHPNENGGKHGWTFSISQKFALLTIGLGPNEEEMGPLPKKIVRITLSKKKSR